MRKVLVCKSELLPYSETFIRDQALAYRSWMPVIIGLRRVPSGLPLDGLEVRWLNDAGKNSWGKYYRKVLSELGLPFPGAVAQLRGEKASLAHVHFATEAVLFWPIVRHLDLPLVVTLHGYDINIYRQSWEKGFPHVGDRRYPERILAIARQRRVHFVAVSNAIKQRAIAYGIPSDRIHVRYIGIDLARFAYNGFPVSQRRRRILYVGRMVEKKGGEFVIKAYARIRAVIQDVELAMAGDGPLTQELTELARELSAPVEFLGAINGAEVKRQIDVARVFCLPSVTATNGDAEGLGIAILEAQACGVPVVTSARGGATEGLIEGVTGFSFPERDVDALTARLLCVLQDDKLADSMSRAGPKFIAQSFDVQHCTKLLESLYDSLLEEQ